MSVSASDYNMTLPTVELGRRQQSIDICCTRLSWGTCTSLLLSIDGTDKKGRTLYRFIDSGR